MAVSDKHPQWTRRWPDWVVMHDAFEGERVIKDKGIDYLPPTEGMRLDGMGARQEGLIAYEAYKNRSVYPDYVSEGVGAMVGVLHREPARIVVPPQMEPLLERLGANGESAWTLLRQMNALQLTYGRLGALVDVPDGADVNDSLPYVTLYEPFRVINWDDGHRQQGRQALEFVTIDESDYERGASFNWEYVNRYRVCAMSRAAAKLDESNQEDKDAAGVYMIAKVEGANADITGADWITPELAGKPADIVPFWFINTEDLVPEPPAPPLLGLANVCLSIYRGEADYRQNLHMQGQDTFVTIGADDDDKKATRLGAGAKVSLPPQGDAKFVGVGADGLDAQRLAIENDKKRAEDLTSKLFESTGTTYQSGEALRIRVSAKTATLRTVSQTSDAALQQILQFIARWMGLNDKDILVESNTDFIDTAAASRTALELTQAKTLGFPLSQKSLHRYSLLQGLTEMTYEEEMSAIEEETPVMPAEEGGNRQGVGGIAGGILGRATGGSRVSRRGAADGLMPGDDD